MPGGGFARRVVAASLLAGGLAGDPAEPVHAQDIAARLQACGACHGENGNSVLARVPSLAGQPKVFVETQLVMIREGLREIPEMKGLLEGVGDAEVTALARHFAAQAPKTDPGPKDASLFEKGRALAEGAHCGSCHLPDFRGREQMPRLAGQREDYLLHAMELFHTGRATGRDTIMAASLYGMSSDDLKAIAHFLAHSPP
ncbi:MAG: cytochrome c [Lautropia sp.]